MERITPENITELKENEVFVFGSNESGRHGKGAAKTALGWGARWGQASGIQGKTYAIPTKDASIRRTLTIDEIKPYVDDFINWASHHTGNIFLVTEIGCGLAGYKPKDIAPLFKEAINLQNVYLPQRFIHKLSKTFKEWLISVKKEQEYYPALKGKDLNDSHLYNYFIEGKTVIEALNGMLTAT